MLLKKSVLTFVLLVSLVFSPSVPGAVEYELTHDENPTSLLPPESYFSFVVSHEEFLGRAFIADGYIFSASHIFNGKFIDILDRDIHNLGKAPINGATISFVEEKVDSFLFFWTYDRSLIPLRILSVSREQYTVQCRPSLGNIQPGDSGSPVFNIKGEVVGLVSSIWIGSNGLIGNIERITKDDLVLEDAK